MFPEVGVKRTQGREVGTGYAFAAFPAARITSPGYTGPDGAILFASPFPAGVFPLKPDQCLQNIAEHRVVQKCWIPVCGDGSIPVETALFQFGCQCPGRGKERTPCRYAIGTI
jgi:hypothetical protein